MAKLIKAQEERVIKILDEYIVPLITEEEAKEYLPKFLKQIDKFDYINIMQVSSTELREYPYTVISQGFLWYSSNEGSDYWEFFYNLVKQRKQHGFTSDSSS